MIKDYSEMLPPMLFGEELKRTMEIRPQYEDSYCDLDSGSRMLKLMDLYKVFYPQTMASGYLRIYDKNQKAYVKLDGTAGTDKETHFKIKKREEM